MVLLALALAWQIYVNRNSGWVLSLIGLLLLDSFWVLREFAADMTIVHNGIDCTFSVLMLIAAAGVVFAATGIVLGIKFTREEAKKAAEKAAERKAFEQRARGLFKV